MRKEIVKFIQEKLPSEFRRKSSLITLVVLYILVRIIEGLFSRIGELITEKGLPLLPGLVLKIWEPIYYFFSYSISVNLFQIILVVFIFLSLYKLIDKTLLKRAKKEIIFEDDFSFGNKGWKLNYWSSNDQDKTCRIEHASMIFEAEDSDLVDKRKENGAYFDLTNGVYENSRYEISCWVKSSKNTTMGFKLWVHDKQGNADMKFPASFFTPGREYKEIKVTFIGTKSQALRIHLHYKAGKGKIFVNKVVVTKI